MDFPLGPTLVMSLCVILKTFRWKTGQFISNQLFIDGLLILLFQSKEHVEKFRNYLNQQHKNIKFTSEIEENGFQI